MKRNILIILTLLLIAVILSFSACNKVLSPEEEASRITGLPVPLPTYLPEGYEIKSIDVEGDAKIRFWDIGVLIEETGTGSTDSPDTIKLSIRWFTPGYKIQAEKVDIGDRKALVFRKTDSNQLMWRDSKGRGITLTCSHEIEFDEVVKIAESITTPPSEILEASLEPEDKILILRGESKQLTVHLQNNSIENIKATLERNDELPEEIEVNIHEESVSLKSGETKDIKIDIKVGEDSPSPTWPHRSASETFPEEETPPAYTPITEPPYYRLRFSYGYEISGVVPRRESLSAELIIDLPSSLPSGLASLQEAIYFADFPVSALLPSYLPESINPPPLGYEIGTEEPYCITAVYSCLRVVLCPAPGITEPPESVKGERTTIRTKQVVIGENKIDWWVYDMHFSIVSDEIPMDELKLVTESMLLIGPYSNSWLETGY